MPSNSEQRHPQGNSYPFQTSSKDVFKYYGQAGQAIPRFNSELTLPPQAAPSPRLRANMGLGKIPAEPVETIKLLGIAGVVEDIILKDRSGKPTKIMPANLTRCRPDKLSDDFFVERRLNGFNPGQMSRVENLDWQYVICYDCRQHNFTFKPGAIFPHVIEARFVLADESLEVHSIEYELIRGVKILKSPRDDDWEEAKRLFRCAEIVFQESQSHLASTHLNVEQYAMAYYRNIVDNPIKFLLAPHFDGLLYVNKLGASNIFGPKGIIPQNSALTDLDVEILLKEEVQRSYYRGWHPRQRFMPDQVTNNLFDRAALAVWEIIEIYVESFLTQYGAEIQRLWPEIQGMSDDLVEHSILDEQLKKQHGTLEIANIEDLQQLCIYVIYHGSFLHSWLNYKQYEDGGDVEYTSIGLWDDQHPDYNPEEVAAKHIRQVLLAWTLSRVLYNPILAEDSLVSSPLLRELLWKRRDDINPGLPVELLMASIHV